MTPADDLDIGFTGARFGGGRRRRRRMQAEESVDAARQPGRATVAEDTDEADTAAIPVLDEAEIADPAPAEAAGLHPAGVDDVPAVGYTGARFGGASRRHREREQRPEPVAGVSEPAALPPPVERLGALDPAPNPALDPAVDPALDPAPVDGGGRSLAVRPYFYTRGRTRSRYELAIETLVSTPPAALRRPELAEHTALLELCREPRSIAEVGAIMRLPLGVARVVVGDLAMTGGLEVHRTATAAGPDLALMERVLSGLRRL